MADEHASHHRIGFATPWDMDVAEQERLVDQGHLPEEVLIVSGTPVDARMSHRAPGSTMPKTGNKGTDLVTDSMLSSVLLQSLEQQKNLKCCEDIFSLVTFLEDIVCIVLQYCITQILVFY